jgi:subtilisin family serine protease
MRKSFVAAFICILTALVLVSPAVRSQGPEKVQQRLAKFRRNARPVTGQYIVVLDDTVVGPRGENSSAHGLATAMASVHRGKLLHVFKHAIQGFSVRMPEAAALALSRDPRVLFVEEDGEVSAVATQTLPPDGSLWGLDRIDQRDMSDGIYHYEQTGAGVNVYVIDTGIRASHIEFGGRASAAFDALGGDGQDCNGHGTHVAGTIGGATYGVAKGVNLFGVRVVDCQGYATYSNMIAGVNWVTANHAGPSIANMSLAVPPSAALDLAVTNSINSGVTYVVAAGNSNANACNYSPARVPAAYTVGATDASDQRASFSNFGTCVDLFAPGQNIRSTWNTSDTAVASLDGTSMAAPHVAGIAALQTQAAAAKLVPTTPCRVRDAGAGSPTTMAFSETGTVFCNVPPVCQGANCRQFVGWIAPNTVTPWGEPCGGLLIQAPSGTHQAWLTGPVGSDFELSLMKEVHPPGMASFMIAVAVGDTAGSACESASYSGTPALYYWRVKSKNGSSGNFTVTYTTPQ